ncbi:hypothetical protein [Burkholderia cenocepacia]|nr:hypothetical protein [Burkholderia cenocepacia]
MRKILLGLILTAWMGLVSAAPPKQVVAIGSPKGLDFSMSAPIRPPTWP